MRKLFFCASKTVSDLSCSQPSPYIRKTFRLDFVPQNARISVCGLGFYRFFVNGTELTKGYFAPYISNPDHILYYDTYDLSTHLRDGANCFGWILGNGFQNPFGGSVWDFDKVSWRSAPCLTFSFSAKGPDGQQLTLGADDSLKTHPSPWTSDEYRLGESYDAAKELPGWNLPDFDDGDWAPAIRAAAPKGSFRLCRAEPIRKRKELRPVSVNQTEEGYLYDFGENSAGILRINLRNAAAGQAITVRCCERLKDGRFNQENLYNEPDKYPFYRTECQKLVYKARGIPSEVWEQSFSWFGFRYALVCGISDAQANADLLTFEILNSDLKPIGSFRCSDPYANRLTSIIQNAVLSNFYYFPTDCPHREKNGWTGDASMSAANTSLLFDTTKSYLEWLRNIVQAQREDGALPGIVPTGGWGFAWGNGPAWDSVLFFLPEVLYRYRGNTEGIRIAADAMIRYLRYLETRRQPDGTIAIGLGDWAPVGKKSGHYETPVVVTDSMFAMVMARYASDLLRRIGRNRDAGFARGLFRSMRKTVREQLMDPETCLLRGNTQTAQAMGLYYDVFEPKERQKALLGLLSMIRQNNDRFDCGFLGMHCLFHVLSRFGQGELAWKLAMQPGYPSYRHLVDIGETAMVESFQPDGSECGSHNHHFFGDLTRWYLFWVAGLQIRNSSRVTISSFFPKELQSAEGSYDFPSGTVKVHWKRNEKRILLTVSHPKGISVDFRLPGGVDVTEIITKTKGGKSMKLGVITDCLKKPLEEALVTAAQIGFSGVQIYATTGEFSPDVLSADARKKWNRTLAKLGLEVSALCGDMGGFGFEREEDNPERVEKTKRIIDLAVDLHTHVVTTHIGVIPSDMSHPRFSVMCRALTECGLYAKERGVTLAIETGPEKAATLLNFLRATKGGVGVNLDPANFVMVTGQDPAEAVYLLRDYIVHTHVKDGKKLSDTMTPEDVYHAFAVGGVEALNACTGFEELPIGRGCVDWDAYLSALREIGYQGYFTLEREAGDRPEADIREAVSFLRGKAHLLDEN